MKRLLIALAAAVAVSTASAIIKESQLFEDDSWSADFVVDSDDDSELAEYGGTQPTTIGVPYPCPSFGEKYLSLDTGDTMLWCTNTAAGTIYFDMALQFNPSASAPELAQGDSTKILLYQNAESNLVILAGETVGGPATNYVTTTTVAPGTWARVTVSSELGNDGYTFTVRLNGTVLATAGGTNSFPSLTDDTTITKVGFSGSGALDNFVVRTTTPYYSGTYAARIGGNTADTCEMYSTYSEALADALATTTQDASVTITRPNETTSNGSENNPYAIEDVACLIALQEAVLANPAVRSLHYAQTANIDMASAGAFAGIGTYNVNPGSGTPFTGVYDGRGYKIYNVTLTDHDYAGIFNMVDGVNTVGCGVVKNLTVEDVSYVGTASTYCASIVGYALRGATLQNLTSAGTFGLQSKPGTHNMAGIVIRVSGGTEGDGTQILYCTNNATIYGSYTKLAGICAISQEKGDTSNKMVFTGCANNGDLVLNRSSNGVTGFAGIVGYSDVNTVMTDCSHAGTLANQGSGYNTDCNGALVGQTYGHTITDGGNNSAPANEKMVGLYKSGGATVTGFQYATVDNGMATTVTTLAKDTTYLLEGDVAASETPVYTFNEAGTIAFDTALGYTFAGTVTTDNGMLDVTDGTAGTVTTYTATEGTVVATITKSGNTTSYNTLQKALTAAESGDTVNLVGAATGAVTIPAGITVQLVTGYSLAGVTTLAGEGVLALPSGESPQPTVQLLCQQSTWEGTLYIRDVDISSAINLTLLGNANSTVRFNNAGCAFTTGSTTAHAIKALEIGPNGLDLIGNYSSGTFTFPCALTGTGNLKIAAKDSQYGTDHKVAKFTGDVSGFAGSISFDADANCAVYFGDAAGNGNCISVAAGSAVTVAAGKTWTAPGGFVVSGSMTVNGTLDAGSEKLYGSGTIAFNAATSLVVANTWTGTYNANFKAANNAIVYIPVNASATTVINGVNGGFGGYPKFGSGAPTVAGPVTLNANWTVANGWTGTDYTTTFAKLSGSGNLMVDGTTSGTDPIYYTITELDNYTGTIGGARGAFTIGKVNVTEQPTNGACVVKTAIGANGSINDNVPLYVGGVDTGKTLTYNASGAEGAGLYLVAPSGFDGGDGATFNIPAETQTALATKLPSGKTLADVADAASGMTYAQAYALGLLNETTGDVEDLKATIEVVGGKVKVSLDATAGTAYTVTLKVYEKASLSAEWPATATETYTLGNEGEGFTPGSATAGFYKVEVSIANK